jgi:hypothetical protein
VRGVASDKEFLASDLEVRGEREKICAEVTQGKTNVHTSLTRRIKAESAEA